MSGIVFRSVEHFIAMARVDPDTVEIASEPGTGLEGPSLTMAILEALAARRDGLGVSDLARALSMSKPRVHRYLRSLVALGYAEQREEGGRYRVGVKVYLLGQQAAGTIDIVEASRNTIRRLSGSLGQSVTVCRMIPDAVVIAAAAASLAPLDLPSRFGTRS